MDIKPSDKLSSDEQLRMFRRALAAYYGDPETTEWPDTEAARFFRRKDGLNYIVLHGATARDLLAVYRIRHDGKLKRLSRLPEGVD